MHTIVSSNIHVTIHFVNLLCYNTNPDCIQIDIAINICKKTANLFQLELILRGVKQQFKQKLWIVSTVLHHLITQLATPLVTLHTYSK